MSVLPTIGPSLLFCPANRPARFEKALSAADAVIIDLEDAIAPDDEEKSSARENVREHLRGDPDKFFVRINGLDSPWYAADVDMLRDVGATKVVLPKVESAAHLLKTPDLTVIALCETVRGVVNSREIAEAENCAALFFGAEDLTADLGGRSSRSPSGAYHSPIEYARSEVLFAATAAGKAAIDAVFLDIRDPEALEAESRFACDMGFAAKGCIHPDQVQPIRRAYAPSDEQITWARGLLDAVAVNGPGVFQYQGQMVDKPLYQHAHTIMTRTEN